MVRLFGFFKSLLKTSKRGEIATLLIVASLAIAAIGAFVGSQQKKTDTTRTNAQGVYPPFPTEEAIDNTDNNPLVTYLETDGDCTVRIRVVRDPGIWVELSNGSGDSTRFYVAQLNGINSSNRSATLDWRPSVPNNQILIRTINPGTSTRYLPRPEWLGRGPTYIRWVYSMKTSPSDPDPRVFYKLQTVNGCRDSVPPTIPPTCTPGSPSCPFSPTPTTCTPGSPSCPFSPTPTCTPGSPRCPFTPTPTTCTPGSPSCPFSPTPTCTPGSPACPFSPTPTTCTPGSPSCPFSPTPTCTPGSPSCPFSPTPTCTPGSSRCPFSPTPTCVPGSGMPGCPAFTPTPTVCPAARSAPFIIGYDNTNISEYSMAGTSGNISWGPLSFAGAQSRSLGGGKRLFFFPHSNLQVPGSLDSTIHLRRNGNNLDNDSTIVAFCYTSSEYPVNPNASMPSNVGATDICRGWYQGVVNLTNKCGSLNTYGWELPRPPVTPTCVPGSGMPGCPRFTPTPTNRPNRGQTYQVDLDYPGGQCYQVWYRGSNCNKNPHSNCGGSGESVSWTNNTGSPVRVKCQYNRCDDECSTVCNEYRGSSEKTIGRNCTATCSPGGISGSSSDCSAPAPTEPPGSCRRSCSWCANDDQCVPAGGHVVEACQGVCREGLGCCVGAGGNSIPNPALQRRAVESPSVELFSKLDADGSKNIGVGDFFSWLRAFAAGDTAKCDFNGDGKCRVDDATLMFKYMGTSK